MMYAGHIVEAYIVHIVIVTLQTAKYEITAESMMEIGHIKESF